jgi:hypothetical protein
MFDFVLDISEAVKTNDLFEDAVTSHMNSLQCDKETAVDLIMQECVLRCQRNGQAYREILSRFQDLLLKEIEYDDNITAEGIVNIYST